VLRLGRAAFVVVLLACLAAAGSAAARSVKPRAKFAVGSASVRAAQQIARDHWGTDPCSGTVQLRWVHLDDPTINAMSSWRSYGAAYANPAANRDCRIEFNTIAEFDWPKFCTVLVHEYGHLAGRPHDERPGHLMSAIYTTPLPECESRATARRGPASRRSAPRRRAG